MKHYISIFMMIFSVVVSFAATSETKLITYPAPNTEKVRCSYSVFVNGQKLDIYKALSPKFYGGEYYFCYFDFEGEVDVLVKSTKPFTHEENKKIYRGEVLPQSIKLTSKTAHEMRFKQNKPFKAMILRDGRKLPLFIFGNPLEKNIPNKNDPNVIYLEAGVHILDKLVLKDNQTLYLEGGAVLKTVISAKKAKNITIRGRGIVSSENYEKYQARNISFVECKNIRISDVIFKDSMSWHLEFFSCEDIIVDNLKICGSRTLEDDGIDVCSSKNVIIKNTFIRVQDDCVPIKGFGDKNPVENVLVENCILWTDSACVFRVGYECGAPYFKNIKCKNIYVPFYSRYVKPTEYWSHAIVRLHPVNEMPIENFSVNGLYIRSNGGDMPLLIAQPRETYFVKKCGSVKNCFIKNVVVDGVKGNFRGEVFIEGTDEQHKVSGIKVENVKYFGKKLTPDYPHIHIGKFTENINVFKK